MPIRILLAIVIVFVLYPGASNAAPPTKFDFLMRFYDLNVTAFAYHRHCLSAQGAINPAFLKTLEYVADELFAESLRNNPKVKPDYIKSKILERRYSIQYNLDHANMKEGCYSAASLEAKEHYLQFNDVKQSDVRDFIDEQTYN